MTTYDKPGRGAWTQIGGLLPLKPGNTNPSGYYRPPYEGELMVGSAYPSGRDRSYSALVVHESVKVVQRLVGTLADGLLGDQTGAAIVATQRRYGLTRDAVAGPATLRAALTPLIESVALAHQVPVDVLGGVCLWESRLDPGAIGVSGYDTGIAQINREAAAAEKFSLAQCLDPMFSLRFTAVGMRSIYDRWEGETVADPWDIAVANHNSPASARRWAETGKPPYSQSRHDQGFPQIDEYVHRARTAWSGQEAS